MRSLYSLFVIIVLAGISSTVYAQHVCPACGAELGEPGFDGPPPAMAGMGMPGVERGERPAMRNGFRARQGQGQSPRMGRGRFNADSFEMQGPRRMRGGYGQMAGQGRHMRYRSGSSIEGRPRMKAFRGQGQGQRFRGQFQGQCPNIERGCGNAEKNEMQGPRGMRGGYGQVFGKGQQMRFRSEAIAEGRPGMKAFRGRGQGQRPNIACGRKNAESCEMQGPRRMRGEYGQMVGKGPQMGSGPESISEGRPRMKAFRRQGQGQRFRGQGQRPGMGRGQGWRMNREAPEVPENCPVGNDRQCPAGHEG